METMEFSFLSKLSNEQKLDFELFVKASKAYYTEDEPIMDDSQFDELQETLLSYNISELTNFIQSRIYREDKGMINVVTDGDDYTQEMISLKKLKYKDKSSISEIRKYFSPNKAKQLYYGPKLDGGALKITWNFDESKPRLVQILSRGGLDVTEKFKTMIDIIETSRFGKHIIAGELVCAKKVFEENYSDDYENPRNFVGKLMKQNIISQSTINLLNFVPCTDGINPLKVDMWQYLTNDVVYNLEEKIKYFKSEVFPFLCDGIVIAYFEDGPRKVKDNYPLNMLAVKFPAPRAKTKVIGFEWTQKKSGKLTPKLQIIPVLLEGSTMTKANGYNYQNVLDARIGIGSEIEIQKSGDIIPVVAKVITHSSNVTLPECDYYRSGKHLIASNLEESRKYKFTLGIRLLNIDGIGDTLSEQIGQIVDYDIIELFNKIHKPDICNILGGEKIWLKFNENFYSIKTLYLDTVIAMLQFNGVGPVIAKRIAMLITKQSNDKSNIAGDVLTNVCRGEGFQKITQSIQILKGFGISVIKPIEINEDTITYEMTGNPVGMTKEIFSKNLKEKFPNAIHTGLTKETKYLFCDDLSSNTSKCNKARKYNIKMILYSDALKGNL